MPLFKSSWGNVELWLSSIETTEGSDLVVQKTTRGNVPSVQNHGGDTLTARCGLIFDDIRGQRQDAQERLTSLIALKEQRRPFIFVHPFKGSYLAEISDFTYSIDENSVITGNCTFIAVEDVGAVVVYPLGVTIAGGSASVGASADALDAQLSDVELSSTIAAAARSASSAMDAASSARDVFVQLADITARINQGVDDLQTGADIALWPVFKTLVDLGGVMLDAANYATSDQGGLFTIRVDRPQSLRALIQTVSGGVDFDEYYQSALDMNDIPTPARIPTGTQLKLRRPKES